MSFSSLRVGVVILVFMLFCGASLFSQTSALHSSKRFESPENLVKEIYQSVSFDSAGPKPDWEKVRSMFLDNAVIVLRVTRDSMAVFSVQGFIDDFVGFIDRSAAKQRGFSERIVRMKPMVFGNIAHVLVLYEAQIPGSQRPPQRGVDSWELLRRNGRWWIVSVTNEIPAPDRPIPAELGD
jgi:hypothetical protein